MTSSGQSSPTGTSRAPRTASTRVREWAMIVVIINIASIIAINAYRGGVICRHHMIVNITCAYQPPPPIASHHTQHPSHNPTPLNHPTSLTPITPYTTPSSTPPQPPPSPGDPARKAAALETSLYCYELLLRLLHPLMPFVTEELWLALPRIEGVSLTVQPWPRDDLPR